MKNIKSSRIVYIAIIPPNAPSTRRIEEEHESLFALLFWGYETINGSTMLTNIKAASNDIIEYKKYI